MQNLMSTMRHLRETVVGYEKELNVDYETTG